LDAPPNGKKFIAVGEIGIDLYWETQHIEAQREAFRIQVGWAKERGIPIVIHVRNAWDALFEEMDKLNDDSLTGVFHCFTGGKKEAEKAIEYGGFMLGIGGVSTYKNGGLDLVLPEVSLEHLVLETDSPYLSPVPHRGKRNESSYVVHVARRVAEIKGLSIEEVASVTTGNAEKMFQLVSEIK
jgi:TatD DNase family protein